MKVLVTGAAGFIGSTLSHKLLERGDTVVGLDNLNDYYDVSLKEDRLARLRPHDRFSFARIDLEDNDGWTGREKTISIRGLTPGVGFKLAECCHPVPGDRIVGLRKKDEGVEVHAIDCLELASGIDADWLDLSWAKRSQGAVGRLSVTVYDRPGTLAEMAGIFAQNTANVKTLEQVETDHPFVTYETDLEVQDLAHLTRILSALRASDAVAQADRM